MCLGVTEIGLDNWAQIFGGLKEERWRVRNRKRRSGWWTRSGAELSSSRGRVGRGVFVGGTLWRGEMRF